MGLFLTLLYILTAYVGAETIFGDLAQYRVQVIIGLVAMVVSVLSAAGSGVVRLTQTYAILGLTGAVILSTLLNVGPGLALGALEGFLPNAIAFFFVVINCRKKVHLQMLVAVLLFSALYTCMRGFLALQSGETVSPYLIGTTMETGGKLMRICGRSFIADPNDLSQFIVALIPIMFLFWVRRKTFANLLLVILPIGVLVYGMYLTRSRGGMLALVMAAIVAGRRKIGLMPAAITGAVLFVGLSAAGWSGGREVSAAQGGDRMGAWGVGLELVRAHPLFGVGFQRFGEFYEITAHNTVVVCAAELGLVGFFCWMLFVLPTIRDAIAASGSGIGKAVTEDSKPGSMLPWAVRKRVATSQGVAGLHASDLRSPKATGFDAGFHTGTAAAALPIMPTPGNSGKQPVVSEAEFHRLAGLMIISFAGFFTAGWFLSRSYIMTLFINAGIVQVIYRMAREQGTAPPQMPFPRTMKLSLGVCTILIIIVYGILRTTHLLGR